MAESVSLHTELMVDELEQLIRLGLYKKEEIDNVIKRRKEFEYKTERTRKEKQDFLQYIDYEVKFMKQIKGRRDKFRKSEKKSEIEYVISKKIVKLYQTLLRYFPHEVKIWTSYINFCTHVKFWNVVSSAFHQMLQVHGDKMELWSFAAKWELYESKNIEGALNYLKTGLHHHPTCPKLYTEAFKLELQIGDKATTPEEKEKAVRRAGAHFKAASTQLSNDVEFIVELLNIATEYNFTDTLQFEIIDYLSKNCWKSEYMWHTMALRELNGHHFNKNDRHKSSQKLCLNVYKTALTVLNTPEMWEKYLDTVHDIYEIEKNINFRQTVFDPIYQEAFDKGFLQEKHYLAWIEVMEGDEKLPEILEKATKNLPKSKELWLSRVRYYISKDDEKIISVAREGINALGGDSLDIYQILIRYYQLKSHVDDIDTRNIRGIFEEAIHRTEPEIVNVIRPQYLDWVLIANKAMNNVRKTFEEICQLPPPCIELHKKMIKLEMITLTPNVAAIRKLYRNMCNQFGKTRTDVWIEHIKFEKMHGDCQLFTTIYNNAKNTLNEDLLPIFTSEFSVLQMES